MTNEQKADFYCIGEAEIVNFLRARWHAEAESGNPLIAVLEAADPTITRAEILRGRDLMIEQIEAAQVRSY